MNTINNSIAILAKALANNSEYMSDKCISKANYDKTYEGYVAAEVEAKDGSKRWRIVCNNASTYDLKPEVCNIKSVGQKVRVYIPNHNFADKYAEVIGDEEDDCLLKDLGDGLYQYGEHGDLLCIYEILGTDVTKTSVTYHYGKYDIIVSWTETKDGDTIIRTDPTWERVYKENNNA